MSTYTCPQGIQAERRTALRDGYTGFIYAYTAVPEQQLTAEMELLAWDETTTDDGQVLVCLQDAVEFDDERSYDQVVEYFQDVLPATGTVWELESDTDGHLCDLVVG